MVSASITHSFLDYILIRPLHCMDKHGTRIVGELRKQPSQGTPIHSV